MLISRYQAEMRCCIDRASEILGEPALPVSMDYSTSSSLMRDLRLEERRGLGTEPAWMHFHDGTDGHELYVGLARYRWETDERVIHVVRVAVPPCHDLGDFWAVPASQYRHFYRRLRRKLRTVSHETAPVMHAPVRQRLWDNTVGLLLRSQATLAQYGVPMKRGVLLSGQPGNGKTMACRWLASQCRRHGLQWSTVSSEAYAEACSSHAVPSLFCLNSSGVILFDDFDQVLRNREQHNDGDRQSTFLTQLDGIRPKVGVVYLFTSNNDLDRLDPAIRRPGRIDVTIRFPKPDAELRRRLLDQTWHSDIRGALDMARVVTDTEGCSFAEIEELRTLLVLHYLDTRQWDWDAARNALGQRCHGMRLQRPIGFSTVSSAFQQNHSATSAHGPCGTVDANDAE